MSPSSGDRWKLVGGEELPGKLRLRTDRERSEEANLCFIFTCNCLLLIQFVNEETFTESENIYRHIRMYSIDLITSVT